MIYIFDDDDEYDYDYEDKSDYKKKKPSYKSKYHKDEEDEGYDFAVETFISSKISNFFNLLILGGILLLPMAVAAEITPDLEAIMAQIEALSNLLTQYYVVLTNQLVSVIATLADIVTSLATLTTSVTAITTTLTGITTTLTGITTSLTNIQTTLTAIQAAIAGIGRRKRLDDDNHRQFLLPDPYVLNIKRDKIEDHFWFIFDIPLETNSTLDLDLDFQFDQEDNEIDKVMIELCINEALEQKMFKVIPILFHEISFHFLYFTFFKLLWFSFTQGIMCSVTDGHLKSQQDFDQLNEV